jgi:hypothetical protein
VRKEEDLGEGDCCCCWKVRESGRGRGKHTDGERQRKEPKEVSNVVYGGRCYCEERSRVE